MIYVLIRFMHPISVQTTTFNPFWMGWFDKKVTDKSDLPDFNLLVV